MDGMGTAPAPVGQLRFLTCGSVDDGKSTLIGRLLWDTQQVLGDQALQLRRDSGRHNSRHGAAGDAPSVAAEGDGAAGIDFSLLLDGLEAEREQGITIDVAYRYFATARRRFIVADTPGHEQYTRNMATGASAAELAIVLVDARRGVLTQTRRHAFIAGLMGIRHLVLAVNKMDLAGFSQERFDGIVAEFRAGIAGLGFRSVQAIPLCARNGDNVMASSPRTPWYDGPSLIGHLETVDVDDGAAPGPFRMAVQHVTRPGLQPGWEGRGYAGTVAGGAIRPGDSVLVQPSKRRAVVRRLVTMDGDLPAGAPGDAVTVVLDRELDVSRGDLLASVEAPATVADGIAAHLVWLSDAPLQAGQRFLLKLGTRVVGAVLRAVRCRVDVDTREPSDASALALNEIGVVELVLDAPLVFEPFVDNRELGGFILIARGSGATVGVGMVDAALPPGRDAVWQALDVDAAARAGIKGQQAGVVWLTGLSGSGKSTIANLVERRLHAMGRHTYVLDGDRLRHGLNADLGFSPADRAENVRRLAAVAAVCVDAGLIVLVSAVSPYRDDRALARAAMAGGAFLEAFVDTPLEECRKRDPKGLYRRADAGLLPGFTGVGAPYEAPAAPELHLATAGTAAEDLAAQVVEGLRTRGWLDG